MGATYPLPDECTEALSLLFRSAKRKWLTLRLCREFQSHTFCRRVMFLVKAGAAVDATIESVRNFLEEGDIMIDGGNEW